MVRSRQRCRPGNRPRRDRIIGQPARFAATAAWNDRRWPAGPIISAPTWRPWPSCLSCSRFCASSPIGSSAAEAPGFGLTGRFPATWGIGSGSVTRRSISGRFFGCLGFFGAHKKGKPAVQATSLGGWWSISDVLPMIHFYRMREAEFPAMRQDSLPILSRLPSRS
jgi:hypothetical protein